MTLTDEELTREQMCRAQVATRTEFTLLDRVWEIHPGVFSPRNFVSTELFASIMPYPAGGSFLEIGTGAGVIGAQAALAGCREVVATDISAAAVVNARANAERQHVADRVHVQESDLFDALSPDTTFDVVFWNSNFVSMPPGYRYASDYERAFFDPGYDCHRRYLAQGRRHLAPGGRLLLGFSSLGDGDTLTELASSAGLAPREIAARSSAEEKPVTYTLIELVDTA